MSKKNRKPVEVVEFPSEPTPEPEPEPVVEAALVEPAAAEAAPEPAAPVVEESAPVEPPAPAFVRVGGRAFRPL